MTCVVLSLLFGALGALTYVPALAGALGRAHLSLVQLRPLHTTFASAWLFLAGTTGLLHYLFQTFGEPGLGDRRRFRFQFICFGIAGAGALLTLPLGITSGREYLGLHPLLSLPIWLGWAALTWTFLAKVRHGYWQRPVYVHMWTVGLLLFLYTFAEGHAYLLPAVRSHPIVDLQVQWKSCGTLVAAFNQIVYGCLLYLGEQRSGDRRIAQSRTAFALFGVGLLNSFTNYAHHTYHLPQTHLVKWIAFTVSMLEILLLARLLTEITTRGPRRAPNRVRLDVSGHLIGLAKRWNLFLLTLAILISVPPLNALIHGTHVVMAHAMGSELAIDSYILFATLAWILGRIFPSREIGEEILAGPPVRRALVSINGFLIALVALLLVAGLRTAFLRLGGPTHPDLWPAFPYAFVVVGSGLAIGILRLLWAWSPLLSLSAPPVCLETTP